MLEAVRTLISKFNVGPRKTRFSIVTYDKKAQVRVSFKETAKQNKNALNNLLDSMKAQDRLGNPTRTDLALETVSNEVFTTANGDRPNAPNVMIVFTDGATHKSSKPYSEVLPPLVVSTRILSSLLHHIIANPSFMFLPVYSPFRRFFFESNINGSRRLWSFDGGKDVLKDKFSVIIILLSTLDLS